MDTVVLLSRTLLAVSHCVAGATGWFMSLQKEQGCWAASSEVSFRADSKESSSWTLLSWVRRCTVVAIIGMSADCVQGLCSSLQTSP